MQIRRRYSKTRMAAFRREHLAHNVRFLAYAAFRVRQQYGRRPVVYRWHFACNKLQNVTGKPVC